MEKLKYTGLLFLTITVWAYFVNISLFDGVITWEPLAGLTTILLSVYCIRKIINK